MCTSCAMMASSVTPPAEDEGAEVDGSVEAERVAISVWSCLGLSYVTLHQMVATSMAHMNVKWGDLG